MNYEDISILLVEDNPGDARLIREMLNETEYATAHFHAVGTLREALEAPMPRSSVAALLLDLNLPDSDGIATLTGIREPYADSAIIVLTGIEDEETAIQALHEGAQNYLTKDEVNPSGLGRALRFSIERHDFVRRLRHADRVIMENDLRFRMLIEHSTDLILLVDRSGRVRYASPGILRTFGYEREDRAINAFNALLPEDIPLARETFARTIKFPGRPLPLTVRAMADAGREVWLEGTLTNLLQIDGVHAVVANFRDVTERVVANEQIAFERNKQKALIDSTQDMLWSVDHNFHLVTANKSFREGIVRMSGFEPTLGESILPPIRFGTYDSEEWKGHYQRCLQGESFAFEGHTLEPEPLWGEFTLNPIREGDTVVGVACACRDITGRKSAENRIHSLNAELEDRVMERTSALLRTNDSLREEVLKNQELWALLMQRNMDFMASSTYARRIQNALFPARVMIGFFKDAACLSKPRNVVSGDFLWQHETDKHVFLAVADCTGHGIPGALMSILGNSLMNQVVVDSRVLEPKNVLSEMDKALKSLFTHHEGEAVNDGMDMAYITVDKSNMELSFAGALLRCNILRGDQLIQLNCSRFTLGGHAMENAKSFEQTRSQLLPGDRIVLSSDGYQSQFGGPLLKKINGQRFRNLLKLSFRKPAAEAISFLDREFTQWMGNEEHVDDVLVVMLDV